jgi:uracil-DNA glycosylase family 4
MMNLTTLEAEAAKCEACVLYQGRDKPVFAKGNAEASIMICGMVPAHEENAVGKPFVGRAGKLLDIILTKTNLTLNDVYITNLVKCFLAPGKPLQQEWIDACLPYLTLQILNVRPKCIIALGADAAKALTDEDPKMALGKMRGKNYVWGDTPVIPTYHPSYILRTGGENSLSFSKVLEDFNKAMGGIN